METIYLKNLSMARLTNEHLHSEIKLVKNDIEYLKEGQAKMQADITMIKKVLLDMQQVMNQDLIITQHQVQV